MGTTSNTISNAISIPAGVIHIVDPVLTSDQGYYTSQPSLGWDNQPQPIYIIGSPIPVAFEMEYVWNTTTNTLTVKPPEPPKPTREKVNPFTRMLKKSGYTKYCTENAVHPNQFFLLHQLKFFPSEDKMYTVIHLPDTKSSDYISVFHDLRKPNRLEIHSEHLIFFCALPKHANIPSLSVNFDPKDKLLFIQLNLKDMDFPIESFTVNTIE